MELSDLKSVENIRIYKGSDLAGILARTKNGSIFSYDEDFRSSQLEMQGLGIAFTMPPTKREYIVRGVNLHPFFAGLLPEGLRLKTLKNLIKTSEDDLFSLFLGIGNNCIGDIYAKIDCEEVENFQTELKSISFYDLFKQSIKSSNVSHKIIDSDIPGIMPKISASMISFPLQVKKRAKQYILKLGTKEHPKLIENEHFFMQLAKSCGIEVSNTQIVYDKDNLPGLLIERFDRIYMKDLKSFQSIHVEDACQFLGLYPQDKYRLSFKEIADGVTNLSTSPIIETKKLLEIYIFSYLIGNGDLHAKNISLVKNNLSGRVALSPAYDILSTLPYGDKKMALKIGGRDDNFSIKDFLEFGSIFSIPEKVVLESTKNIIKTISGSINKLSAIGLDNKKIEEIIRFFNKRSKDLL